MSDVPVPRGPPASEYLREPSEIRRALVSLRDHCLPVKLQFLPVDEEFAARILDVTATQLLLEDVKPRSGLQRLRDGETFTLSARLDGVYARAGGLRVVEVGDDYGVPYCVVALPSELLYQQRRHSERFVVRPSIAPHSACIALHHAERVLCGRVVDISAGGCRAVFDVVCDPELRIGEMIERCEFDIPLQLAFTTRCMIRRQQLNKQTSQLECGLEFDGMRLTDRRRLERFIQLLAKVADSPANPASVPNPLRHRDPTRPRARQP
jgi:c-di-GMP-binding flagellar brake protein YcgR